jgi:hypothetical protein
VAEDDVRLELFELRTIAVVINQFPRGESHQLHVGVELHGLDATSTARLSPKNPPAFANGTKHRIPLLAVGAKVRLEVVLLVGRLTMVAVTASPTMTDGCAALERSRSIPSGAQPGRPTIPPRLAKPHHADQLWSINPGANRHRSVALNRIAKGISYSGV